ncbi:hypothetical protein ABIA39_008664 [Nocardia sp. GAS34]
MSCSRCLRILGATPAPAQLLLFGEEKAAG